MKTIAKCRRSARALFVTSSTHAVESNDDLLIEILLRLPIVSLHAFKSVSKRWLTLITNPTFTLSRSQSPIDPPYGIILQRQDTYFQYYFIPLDIRISANRSQSPATFTMEYEIWQSCNGLLLCRTWPDKFYVYNPSINLFKTIPKPEYRVSKSLIGIDGLRMTFDPSKSPHYKLVNAAAINDGHGYSIQIQTYSSITCNWIVCSEQFPLQCFGGFNEGVYWNDAIYWMKCSNRNTYFKLNVEHPFLTSAQTPRDKNNGPGNQKLFESRGCLLLLCTEDFTSKPLNIYEMSKSYSGWSVKYIVRLDRIMRRYWNSMKLLSIMIGEKEEEAFLMMEISGKIEIYKIVLKTLSKVCELKSWINHSSTSFQLIASYAGV